MTAVTFATEVQNLREWIAAYSDEPRSAEWESEFPDWVLLWQATAEFVQSRPVVGWSAVEMDSMLFALARDNEGEEIVDVIARVPATLVIVAEEAIERGEPDARWQVASRLGTVSRDLAMPLLLKLVDDADEYVSRRALLTLGAIGAEQAHGLARRAWSSGHEYQRSAALHVLALLRSPDLDFYLEQAVIDGRPALVAAGIEAREFTKFD